MDRYEQTRNLLGKMVHITVDRPVGYQHNGISYPINYGYVPGVMAADGQEQDAYILGVSEQISSFYGKVIAVIHRKNDVEDKLVVAPDGMYFHQGQIAEAVHFQEKYFDITIDSVLRKSCGVIPFRDNSGRNEYLILKQTNGCWSFPKGHMEAGETEEQTAHRELYEESGLSAALIPDARIAYEYDISPVTRKQVVLFSGKINGDVILQETEVVDHLWVPANELHWYLHPDTYAACKDLLK